MYEIESSFYFYILLAIPVFLLVFLGMLWWQKSLQKKVADAGLLDILIPERSIFKLALKFLFFCLGFVFLVLALVNPKMGTKIKTVKRQGVDIVFALDVSKSMLAEDIAPNRLEKSKQIISKIIDKLGGDRIGIIIYAGSAYPLLPITTDHSAAKTFLQNAHPDMVSSQGTAINEALDLAKNYYKEDAQTNRFLIIITDGEDHQKNTIESAEQLAKKNIKVYTIGVGTKKGAPIPIHNQNGLQGYKKDKKGEVVITHRNSDILKQISQKCKGIYVEGNQTKNALKIIIDTVSKAQKNEFETKQFSEYKDQFQWFLGLALLFFVLDIFIFEKKTHWIQNMNLFKKNKK